MEDTNNSFEQRLKEYRENNNFLKYEFAKKLGVSESFYNMIENGRKKPSKNFIDKLVNKSKKPEEYWVYGIDEYKYTNIKERKGIFIIVHIQKNPSKGTNYIDYVCDTPKEVLLLINTLKMFASPIDENNYSILYTDGENEINYTLEDIIKLTNYSLEIKKEEIEAEINAMSKENEPYTSELSLGTLPPL